MISSADLSVTKTGDSFTIRKALTSVAVDGTVTPVNLVGKTLRIRVVHARTGTVVKNDVVATIENDGNGWVAFTFVAADLANVGMHRISWKVSTGVGEPTSYPAEGFDLLLVEEKL